MPFFKKKHGRTLSTASSGKSSLSEFDDSSSSRTNFEIDISIPSPSVSNIYAELLSMSSYNENTASILLRDKSRLSKSLQELLHDPGSLAYFIQYLDSFDMGHMIKLYLDVQSFYASTITRSHSSQQLKNSNAKSFDGNCAMTDPLPVPENRTLHTDDFPNDCSESLYNGATSANSPKHSSSSPTINIKRGSQDNKENTSKLRESIKKDAVSIYTKYISQDASHSIMVSDSMRSNIIAKICSENGEIDPSCFMEAQEHVLEYLNKNHFSGFQNSVFHCKLQIDLLTSGMVYLADILYNDTALFFFMEFMEQENAHALIEFWLMIHNFQVQQLAAQKANTFDGMVAQQDAMVLYDKYFSLQATCPLGFSDQIRFEIEQNICSETGPTPDCFKKPMALVLDLLESNYLSSFLKSQLFYKYLSELASTIQGGRFPYSHKKRSGSESSGSEHSVHSSNTNTLLAMDGTQPGVSGTTSSKVLKNIGEQDMRIDTGKFNNPSDLWKRDLAGKLEMGKVNTIGQFETEFIPQPDDKKFKITKAVKKFVYKEDTEKDEDMAWQVAQMIIRDVCSVTLKDEEAGSSSDLLNPSKLS